MGEEKGKRGGREKKRRGGKTTASMDRTFLLASFCMAVPEG